jgi:hypothetical protein
MHKKFWKKAADSIRKFFRGVRRFFGDVIRFKHLRNCFKLTRAGEDIENSDSTVGKGRKGNGHQK